VAKLVLDDCPSAEARFQRVADTELTLMRSQSFTDAELGCDLLLSCGGVILDTPDE